MGEFGGWPSLRARFELCFDSHSLQLVRWSGMYHNQLSKSKLT